VANESAPSHRWAGTSSRRWTCRPVRRLHPGSVGTSLNARTPHTCPHRVRVRAPRLAICVVVGRSINIR
jgi:hypothetical protein